MAKSLTFTLDDLTGIDTSLLKPEVKKKIDDAKKEIEKEQKFSAIKEKYEGAIKPLLDKLNAISVNKNVDMITIILTKDLEHSVFTESSVNSTQVKFNIPADLKIPKVCDMFLELMEYEVGQKAVETVFKDELGDKVIRSLYDLSQGSENKRKIQKLLKENPISFDKADLDGLDGLKYVITGSRKDNIFIFTAKCDVSGKVEGALVPSQPKLDADGNKIKGKHDSAPDGYSNLNEFLAAQPADSLLGKAYAYAVEHNKSTPKSWAYHAKNKIAKDLNITPQEIKLSDYIGQ